MSEMNRRKSGTAEHYSLDQKQKANRTHNNINSCIQKLGKSKTYAVWTYLIRHISIARKKLKKKKTFFIWHLRFGGVFICIVCLMSRLFIYLLFDSVNIHTYYLYCLLFFEFFLIIYSARFGTFATKKSKKINETEK